MLIGASAERFVSHDVADVEEEVEQLEIDVLREFREISERPAPSTAPARRSFGHGPQRLRRLLVADTGEGGQARRGPRFKLRPARVAG